MNKIADRRTQGFSHGERTKVALARALVHDPRNVLLDEPTNGLDVMSTRAVRDIIRRLRADGRCVLFSSHVMQEVSALCDSIIVIARGRVVASGTPDELREQTGHQSLEDAFVALAGLEQGARMTPVAQAARRVPQGGQGCVPRSAIALLDPGRRDLRAADHRLHVEHAWPIGSGRSKTCTIPVVGIEHAPALMDWLRQQAGVEIVAGPADPEAAVRDRDEDVVVVVPAEFAEEVPLVTPAPVQDRRRRLAERLRGRRCSACATLLQRYSGEIGTMRLVGRGVSPAIAHGGGQLEEVEVSSAQQRAADDLVVHPDVHRPRGVHRRHADRH